MSDPTDKTKEEVLQRRLEMRRFHLKRNEDATGISGTGYVAEGVQLSDGTCVMRWLSATSCIAIYHSHVELIHIHGHEGKTVIEWLDPEFEEDIKKPLKSKTKKTTKKS